MTLLDKGSLDEALHALQQAGSLRPNNPLAYYHLAELYKNGAVRSAYQKTIEVGPHIYLCDPARKCLEGWHPRIINAGTVNLTS